MNSTIRCGVWSMGLTLLDSHDFAVGSLCRACVVLFFSRFLAKIYNYTVRYYKTYVFLNVPCTSAAAVACIYLAILALLLALLLVVIVCLVTQRVLWFVASDFSVLFSSFELDVFIMYTSWLYCRVYKLDLCTIRMHRPFAGMLGANAGVSPPR